MRKAVFAVLTSFLLFACGKASAPQEENAKPAENEPAPAETGCEEFSGRYDLSVQGTHENTDLSLVFSEDGTGISMMDSAGTKSVKALAEFGDLYDLNQGIASKITITPQEYTGVEESMQEKDPVEFQILSARVNGEEVLALRELGNGTSGFSSAILGMENQTPGYFWIFRRASDLLLPQVPLRKNDTFYAYCWYKESEAVHLQELTYETGESDWYGEERTVLKLSRKDTAEASEAIRYPVDETMQWRIFMTSEEADAKRYEPQLMQVTTDENGNIVKLYYMDYLGYGYYEADGSMIKYDRLLSDDPEHPVQVYEPGAYMTYEDDLIKADVKEDAWGTEMIFFTTRRLKNFRILNLSGDSLDANGEPQLTAEEAFYLEKFVPNHPVTVKMVLSEAFPNHGISYEYEGETKFFYLYMSGKDGSLILTAFEPVNASRFQKK